MGLPYCQEQLENTPNYVPVTPEASHPWNNPQGSEFWIWAWPRTYMASESSPGHPTQPAAHSPLHDAASETQVLGEGLLQEEGGQGRAPQCVGGARDGSALICFDMQAWWLGVTSMCWNM